MIGLSIIVKLSRPVWGLTATIKLSATSKHIFSAEKRYIERLSGEPLTDTASIPNDNLEALFELGQQSRQGLKDFIEGFAAPSWDILKDFEFVGWSLKATPKKIIIHVLTTKYVTGPSLQLCFA